MQLFCGDKRQANRKLNSLWARPKYTKTGMTLKNVRAKVVSRFFCILLFFDKPLNLKNLVSSLSAYTKKCHLHRIALSVSDAWKYSL